MTFVPSLNWPRFFRSSTRSKRFRTLRLAVIVLAPFKLRCCDINAPLPWEIGAATLQRESGYSTRDPGGSAERRPTEVAQSLLVGRDSVEPPRCSGNNWRML